MSSSSSDVRSRLLGTTIGLWTPFRREGGAVFVTDFDHDFEGDLRDPLPTEASCCAKDGQQVKRGVIVSRRSGRPSAPYCIGTGGKVR